MTFFTCPHCGQRASTDRTDIESVNLGNGLPDAIFIAWPDAEERHIDQRLCCGACFDRADPRPLVPNAAGQMVRFGDDHLHPYGRNHHTIHRLSKARR